MQAPEGIHNMTKIYLATPYSSSSEYPRLEEHYRFVHACEIAVKLIEQGYLVFSPIAHSHPIAVRCEIPGDHEHWKAENLAWLAWCDIVAVGMLPGWEESTGVKWEMKWAKEHEKKIRFINSASGERI